MSVSRSGTAPSTVGYSGKPLWQKLGLKPQLRVRLQHAPAQYWGWCAFDPGSVSIVSAAARHVDFAHLFVTSRAELEQDLGKSAKVLGPNGMLWISWPKKSSGIATDITEGTLRELALPLGLVDVKVCAVTEVWSGLKFVWRVEKRGLRA